MNVTDSASLLSSRNSGGEVRVGENMELGDSDGEERKVMSEVHLGCPPATVGPYLSCFKISFPPEVRFSRYNELFKFKEATNMPTLDEDGDLVLPRRNQLCKDGFMVTIQHSIMSTIPDVGLQVWKAELLLSDFILHKICTSNELDGTISLELGAGTGLSGILLTGVSKTVFLTDRGYDILDNCVVNVNLNSSVFSSQGEIKVRELDWMSKYTFQEEAVNFAYQQRYTWNSGDVAEIEEASFIFAADVIYSDDLTDALFNKLRHIMSLGSDKVFYMALEKRYNFSLDDLNVVANGYANFKSYLREGLVYVISFSFLSLFTPDVHRPFLLLFNHGNDVNGLCIENSCGGETPCFVGHQIDIQQIPQYLENYSRGKDLELWRITYTRTLS